MIIFRYLGKEVYGTLLASTVILLLLLISDQFIRYLTQAAQGIIPLRTVMQIMSIQVPLLIGILLPLGLYVGLLMAYGRLYVDREMTVLSACGFSKAQLLGMTLLFATVICLIVTGVMLWLQPKVESYKRHVLIEAAAASPLERILPGQFTPLPSSSLIFYAESLSRDHQHLENVFAAQPQKTKKPHQPWDVVIAKSGQQQIDPVTHDKFLVLNDGYRYSGAPGQPDYQTAHFQQYAVRIQESELPPDKRAESIPTLKLWQQRHLRPANEAELQWRIAMPISVLVLTILGIPLSKVDPRQGRYAQLLPAILLYIVYINLLFMGRIWLRDGKVSPLIGLWWVHGLMLLIGLVLLIRFMGWSPFKRFQRRRKN